jgi:hypothetical protein
MHYRNGREAKNGDEVVMLSTEGGRVAAFGTLQDAMPGNDYCNGNLVSGGKVVSYACLCACIHADALAESLKEKGLDKRPAGK